MERYEEYKDSGLEWIGEVPSHWMLAPAKRFIGIENGSDPEHEGIVPVYGSSGNAFKTCGESKNPPTVLLGRKGTIDNPVFIDHPYWNVDTAFNVVTLNNQLSIRFYYYLAQCFDYAKYQTATTLPSMTQADYREMLIPVPSTSGQLAIADFLDVKTAEIDTLIEETEKSVELLEEYRKSVISEAVTKGLEPNAPMKDSGIEWIGEIPSHWDVRKITSLADRRSGHTPDKTKEEYWEGGDIVWVSLADSPKLRNNRYISESASRTNLHGIENSSAELLPRGSVLLSRDATVGLCAIADCELAVSQHFMAYICGPELLNEYLLDAFYAMDQELKKLSMGSTIPTIGLPLIKDLKIPVPPLEEQQQIAHYVSNTLNSIGEAIALKRNEVDALRGLRKSLISEAVTGKFKVPGVE